MKQIIQCCYIIVYSVSLLSVYFLEAYICSLYSLLFIICYTFYILLWIKLERPDFQIKILSLLSGLSLIKFWL